MAVTLQQVTGTTDLPCDGQDLHDELYDACGGDGTVQKELTLEQFYASDPQRVAAPEVPYGSLWRAYAPVPTYRLACHRRTVRRRAL